MIRTAVLLVTALLVVRQAIAGNDFEKVRGITDGSPYTLSADQGAAGRRAQADNQANAWLERQLRITDGYSE